MCDNAQLWMWIEATIIRLVDRSHAMLKRSALRHSVIVALLSLPGVCPAETANKASTNIPVTASVSQTCSISTTSAIAFGAYDPIGSNATAALNATGQISVSCSKGATGLTIGMDNGTHVAGTQRQMLGGTAAGLLKYNLYQPPNNTPNTACTFPGSTAWTTTTNGLLTISSAPSMVARAYNVCGTIPGGQDVAADTYTDTVGATINF
jgi:spore coat protein U-like protein